MAKYIQTALKLYTDSENKREIKSNDSYYLLKNTIVPSVIIECGFLSNYTESEKLMSQEYQDSVAYSIHLGIFTYLNSEKE